jgi:RNA polymerase primary sigma factor
MMQLINEENAFTLKASEEDDAPAQTVMTAGATADPVKDYLKQIGRVALLNAELEVELATRVEAGLFCMRKLAKA